MRKKIRYSRNFCLTGGQEAAGSSPVTRTRKRRKCLLFSTYDVFSFHFLIGCTCKYVLIANLLLMIIKHLSRFSGHQKKCPDNAGASLCWCVRSTLAYLHLHLLLASSLWRMYGGSYAGCISFASLRLSQRSDFLFHILLIRYRTGFGR